MVRWQLRVVVPVILVLLAALPALGATITVTSAADDGGAGELRAAIASAVSGDTINFNLAYPATITLTKGDLTVTSSITIAGPGANNLAISGGGTSEILYVTGGAVVNISGVTIENGSAMSGGGIMNFASTLTLTDSAVVNNTAGSYNGGGILSFDQATLILNRTTVSGNSSAGNGGGIASYQNASLTLINSTVSGNSATNGGGLISDGSTLTIVNSTIAGNTATTSGGGIVNSNGMLLTKSTLFSANNGGNCSITGGTSTSDGYNLSDDSSCAAVLNSTSDSNGTAAGLDTKGLQNNGGPASTIALLPTSPAVDALPVANCTLTDGTTAISTDQRGVTRPQGSACDIGAFELVQSAGFSSFSAKLDIDGERESRFELNAEFGLSAGGSGFDPSTDVVKLQIASFSVTIPAGSFHQLVRGERQGSYVYVGRFDRTWVAVRIVPLGNNSYALRAEGAPVDFAGLANPVNVTLSVGSTTGTVSVNVDLSPRDRD